MYEGFLLKVMLIFLWIGLILHLCNLILLKKKKIPIGKSSCSYSNFLYKKLEPPFDFDCPQERKTEKSYKKKIVEPQK